MNQSMHESTQESLMKVVERAIRPLQAGKARKLVMREELLGHLTALFHEESARGANDQTALAAARERFGDPAELAQDLASSLTWRDRWAWASEQWAAAIDRTFAWQRGESFGPFALRSGATIAALISLLFLLGFAVVRLDDFLGGDRFDATFASFNRYTFTLFGSMAVNAIALVWAIQSTYHLAFRSHGPRRWPAVATALAGWTALFVFAGALFWFGITLSLESVLERLPQDTVLTAITLPLILFLTARLCQHAFERSQPFTRWTSLQLDE